jgi:predicted transcriptional regulator
MTNEELKKIREDKGLKKGEFAKLLGVTPMIYGRYESGTLVIPEKVEHAVGALEGNGSSDKTVEANVAAVSDAAAATAIEIKKKTRAAGRKAREKVMDTVDAVADNDKVVAAEIETKKKVRKAGRKAKAAAGNIAEAVRKNTSIMIQSQLGGMITPEEVLQRIPENCDAVYIKPEENKAYWVKGLESGCVNLW